MKKITLSVALLASVLATKAQDTLCLMVRTQEVIEFNYYTDTIIYRENYRNYIHYSVEKDKVLCLHLMDEKSRIRKVLTTYPDGYVIEDNLESKNDTYYITGPVQVEIRRPKLMIRL